MKKKATSWEDNIQIGNLPEQEAWQCISSTTKKKLDCPLPELTLPKKVCGELITIIKDAGVPHSLICTNPPLDLFHGTRDYL